MSPSAMPAMVRSDGRLAVSALPGHHPRRFADPVYLPAWLHQYNPDTKTIPVWRADAA